MNGFIRIISGKCRGRKLPVLNSEGLRPTTDRVKEMLFNWLMPVIHDAYCLDCFSGSGSLGFEAFSRGASHVVFIEKNKSVYAQLKKNSQTLCTDNCDIINADSLDWLRNAGANQFNLIFIDPPFNKNLASEAIVLLEKNNWLNTNAYIYVETEQNNSTLMQHIPENWRLHREKITGQVHSRLFIKEI